MSGKRPSLSIAGHVTGLLVTEMGHCHGNSWSSYHLSLEVSQFLLYWWTVSGVIDLKKISCYTLIYQIKAFPDGVNYFRERGCWCWSYLPVVTVRVVVVLLPQMVRSLVVLGVVVVVPPHPLHPLLGRAGQDRFSKHRHLSDCPDWPHPPSLFWWDDVSQFTLSSPPA